jgi:hypothetical protein
LCLDRAGHIAIEPTSNACTNDERHEAESGDTCGLPSHGACEDYVLVQGHLSTRSAPTVIEGALVVFAVLAPELAPPSRLSCATAVLRSHAPPPAEAPSILRC